MKHTPGPWSATANSTDVFTKKDGVFVAKCYDSILGAGVKECQANAKLIAAAPDLLEACKEAVRVFDSNPSSITDTVWTTNRKANITLYELAKAAIAKAESSTIAA